MDEINKQLNSLGINPDEITKQLNSLGINPDEIAKQLNSLDFSFDEIAKKTASMSLPGLTIIGLFYTFGGTGLVMNLATALAGPMGVIGDTLTGYVIDIILSKFYQERCQNEDMAILEEEIDGLLITEALKIKLKKQLTALPVKKIETTNTARIITIVTE
jgi:dimeric dUTPase (all-alpha-NTP-PPase superfamily)